MSPRPVRDVSAEVKEGEERLEQPLRPATFDEYVGQEKLVANFRVYAEAARRRGDALDHVLLGGPPGLGKTSLAHILARELRVSLHLTSGPALVKKGDLAGLLTALAPRDILFIDEIHRLSPSVEEALYPAMEDFRFDVVLGAGLGAQTMEMKLERFTQVEGEGKLDRRIVDLTLSRLEVDADGLDAMDRRILACVIDTFAGGPVGIEAVAASVGEEAGTIEDVYEPFLVREGYLARSPRGRVALPAAYQHLGKTKAGGRQGGLF